MIKNKIIEIWEHMRQTVDESFTQIAELFGEYDQTQLENQPLRLIGFPPQSPAANFDNCIHSKFASSLLKPKQEDEELMQKIKMIRNARLRNDGRFEWRKMINGTNYQIIESNFEKFRKRVNQIKNSIKKLSTSQLITTQNTKVTLYELTVQFYNRNIKSKVDKGLLKPQSAQRYVDALKFLETLNQPIKNYTKDNMIDYLNTLSAHRSGAYVYFLLKNVFADEFEKGNLPRNPIASLKNPFNCNRCSKKGSWLNLEQQSKIKNALDNSILCKEIMFYLATGCRLTEAYDATIDFEKKMVHVFRHKTEAYGVRETYIPISDQLSNYIKSDWNEMFKIPPKNLSKNIGRFFNRLGITNKATHALRHTFSSNLYYLGVDAKRQQYLMGHASIKQTFDTYTTLDMSVTRDDILNIWGDLYPKF